MRNESILMCHTHTHVFRNSFINVYGCYESFIIERTDSVELLRWQEIKRMYWMCFSAVIHFTTRKSRGISVIVWQSNLTSDAIRWRCDSKRSRPKINSWSLPFYEDLVNLSVSRSEHPVTFQYWVSFLFKYSIFGNDSLESWYRKWSSMNYSRYKTTVAKSRRRLTFCTSLYGEVNLRLQVILSGNRDTTHRDPHELTTKSHCHEKMDMSNIDQSDETKHGDQITRQKNKFLTSWRIHEIICISCIH